MVYEYYLTGQFEDAIEPREAALAIWCPLNRKDKVGHTLRQMSRLSWFLGRVAAAERCGAEAVRVAYKLGFVPQAATLPTSNMGA